MTELGQITLEPQVPARFTIAEFEQLASTGVFDGSKVELVEGVIVRMNAAKSLHIALQKQIYDRLLDIFRGRSDGPFAYFEYSVMFGDATVRTIDVAIAGALSKDNDYADAAGVILAIEIANSTLGYDLADKKAEYARAGIPQYWVVDPVKQVIHVMGSPSDGDYMERHLVKFDEPLAVPGSDQSIVITYPA